MKKVRIGMVGGGKQHNVHMVGYRAVPSVEVVAACALPKDVKRFAKEWKISKTYTDIEKLCRDPQVDIVDVALPNYLHAKTAVTAAEEGKAVLCEKPMAINGGEAQKMVAAVEKHRVFNAYTENYTFFGWAEEAKKCLENGILGKPVWMRCYGGGAGPWSPWFFNPKESGGGCLIDLGSHWFGMHRWILGGKKPVEAFCWNDSLVNKQAIEGGTEDYSLAMVKYENGVMSQCETSWGLFGGEGFKIEVAGTEGWFANGTCPKNKVFSIAENTEYLRRFTSMPGVEKGWFLFPITSEEFMGGMISQMQHIISCYLEDKEPRHTFKDGLIVNHMMDAAYKSAKTKKWEKISP